MSVPRTAFAPAAVVRGAVGVALAVLQAGLPHAPFLSGDSSVKLIAARAAAAHPARPLAIGLPVLGSASQPFVDSFFIVHGAHARAATSGLFVLASAPVIALWGIHRNCSTQLVGP